MNDDVDLIVIFNYLKSHIYNIALSGLFGVLLCFIYFAYTPIKYIASLNYSELSISKAETFSNINNSINSYLKQNEGSENINFIRIDPQSVSISFSEFLKNDQVIKKTLKNLKIEDNEINFNNFSKNSKVKYIRRQNQYTTNFNYSIKHEEIGIAKDYLLEIFNVASQETINLVKKNINNLADNIDKEKEVSIRLLTNQLEIERQFAKKLTKDRIVLLKEHAQLARVLNIATPMLTTPLEINIEGEKGFSKLYLEGYKALEGEIKILEQRKSFDPFIENVRKIQKQIENIHINDEIEILKYNVKQLNNSTQPVTYNSYDITIEKSMNRSILFSLSLILGFSITIIILIYYRIYFFKNTN